MNQPPVAPQHSHKILLVDDNPHGSNARKQLLSDVGFTVDIALSGEAALDCLAAGSYDMVVTDYRMGKMDGVKLIERVRSLHVGVKTILLSGYVNVLGMTEKSTGADAVLNKDTAELPNLMRAVNKLLGVSDSAVPRKPAAMQGRAAAARRA